MLVSSLNVIVETEILKTFHEYYTKKYIEISYIRSLNTVVKTEIFKRSMNITLRNISYRNIVYVTYPIYVCIEISYIIKEKEM